MVIDHLRISSYSYYDYPSSADLFELPADLLQKVVLPLQKPKDEKDRVNPRFGFTVYFIV